MGKSSGPRNCKPMCPRWPASAESSGHATCSGIHSSVTGSPWCRVPTKWRLKRATRPRSSSSTTANSPLRSRRTSGFPFCRRMTSRKTASPATARKAARFSTASQPNDRLFNPYANGGLTSLTAAYQTRNGFERAGNTAIPCKTGTCSYAAPNAKSGAGNKVSQPRICYGQQ